MESVDVFNYGDIYYRVEDNDDNSRKKILNGPTSTDSNYCNNICECLFNCCCFSYIHNIYGSIKS